MVNLILYVYFDLIGFFFLVDFFFGFFLFFFRLIIFYLLKILRNDFISIILCFFLILISFNFFFCWSLVYFIVFFEVSSLMVILIALIFGIQVEKINAIYFFFIYNLLRFLPFLLIVVYLIKRDVIINLIYLDCVLDYFFIFFILLVFITKFPLFFFHYWLPKIHVEASTLSRILLASLLLKFGVFGFYRFIFFLKYINIFFFLFIFFLGFLLSLWICLIQSDIKSQIAYSSISHIRVVFFSLLSFRSYIEKFSFFVVIGHAFRSCLRFWYVGEIFYTLKRRLVIEVNSFFLSNIKFSLYFSLILLLIGSFPFSLSYFTEYFIFFIIYKRVYFIFFFIWFFFFDLFFVIFLLRVVFLGKKFNKIFRLYSVNISLFYFWSYNFFFFNNLLY